MSARWSPAELAAVVAVAATMRAERPRATLAELLIAAQDACRPDVLLSPDSLRSYTKHSTDLRAALVAAGLNYPANSRSAAAVAKSALQPPAPPVEAFPRAEPELALTRPSKGLAEASEAELIGALLALQRKTVLQAVETALAARLAAVFDAEAPAAETAAAPAPAAPAPDRLRVMVVGLLPVQAAIAAQRLGRTCALRFWTDNGTDKLRAGARWADRVVTMTKFISHSTEDVIKRMDAPLVRCNGGVTDLVAQVQRMCDGVTS